MSLTVQKLKALTYTGDFIQKIFRRNRWQCWSSLLSHYTKDTPTHKIGFHDNGAYFTPKCDVLSSLELRSWPYIDHDVILEDEEYRGEEGRKLTPLLQDFSTSFVTNTLLGNISLLDLARLAISTLKRRKMKMNKHKLTKRRKLLRAKRDSRK